MYKILKKESLNPSVVRMVIHAPEVARRADAGQFIILRATDDGERVPLTVADFDRAAGTVTIIFQVVGATTEEIGHLSEGDCLADFAGPLGKKTETENVKTVCVIGGGVGSAIAYPVAKKFYAQGTYVDAVVGFRTRELVMLEDEFRGSSNELYIMTDDGTYGEHGLVTEALEKLILAGRKYDEVIAIGPLPMMKYVSLLTKKYGIKTVVSMNPIMIDGTGMCGCCRLTVGGETRFACVDGPEFDGHLVDFDEAIRRSSMYREFETHAREETCNLFKKEVE